jgi:hypothetical protein
MRLRSALLAAPVFLAIGLTSPLLADTGSAQLPASSAKLSHVRAVRLSFTQGPVTMRRPGSEAWSAAAVNTPLQEGFVVATAKGSFAEIQFENGSTVRLGENSSVDFNELALTPEGGHINHLTLDRGYATCNFIPGKHDEYLVKVSGVTLTPRGKAEFRTDLSPERTRVEVFDGRIEASDSQKTEKLGKNHALAFDANGGGAFQVTDKIHKDEWDKWAEARDEQASLAYSDSAVTRNNPLYGFDDLVTYGEWGYFHGFGYGWSPYASPGWSPYSLGAWGWYPGWGYTWISGEPWGWLPFHYGFWNFNPGFGWFWVPGSLGA